MPSFAYCSAAVARFALRSRSRSVRIQTQWPAGVGVLPGSSAQYSATRRVSRGELRPGDLLFYFGSGAHHVGMYIGGGMMVHAANPRDDVEVTAAWGPEVREWGARELGFQDPNGYFITFTEPT